MAYYLTRRSMIRSFLISQGVITFFVFINLFVPREYFQFIMILYFAVFMAIFWYSTARRQRGEASIEEIRSGKRILVIKQEETRDLQAQDLELVQELKPLLKASGISMLSLFIALTWFFFLYPSIVHPYIAAPEDSILYRIIELLVLYEVPMATSFTIQVSTRRVVKKYVNVLRGIEVYTTGLIGIPGLSLKFPIQGYAVRMNLTRKFVEFIKNEGGVEVLYRIYTPNVEKLAEAISRHGKVKVDKI